MIEPKAMATARAELSRHLERTPLVLAEGLSAPNRSVYLKNETVLPTGSFKVRGAICSLRACLDRGALGEVVAASTGNHGAAVAYAGRLFGVPIRVFVPERTNPVKAARIRELGATLVETGRDLSAAIDAAYDYVHQSGALFLHDASHPDVPIGTSTIGAEILEDLPSVNSVFVPMGDTALIRGVASALRQSPRHIHVIGVAAEAAPAYYLSWKAGRVVETETAETAADGLAVRKPLAPNVAAIRELVDDVVTVSEDAMFDAIVRLRR